MSAGIKLCAEHWKISNDETRCIVEIILGFLLKNINMYKFYFLPLYVEEGVYFEFNILHYEQ